MNTAATPNPIAQRKVAELLLKAFNETRPARSPVYRQGVQATLDQHFQGRSICPIRCPYGEGSVELDAFFAGVDEGQAIVRSLA